MRCNFESWQGSIIQEERAIFYRSKVMFQLPLCTWDATLRADKVLLQGERAIFYRSKGHVSTTSVHMRSTFESWQKLARCYYREREQYSTGQRSCFNFLCVHEKHLWELTEAGKVLLRGESTLSWAEVCIEFSGCSHKVWFPVIWKTSLFVVNSNYWLIFLYVST